ncbi:DUF4167 domain-containing protein [Methylovirgula sp. HY1]|uniref:DUF4167 domain-containing protein n=1 Tax=Methylovirgula sp. HY1 TaxID=2822761 RepID=UPI001C5AF3FE|nr:DUF4167 domain-containing protein [Methylovirgula sp. HY1]QXX74991.1 hypothetical protein MHY1_01808 [Methylovirgula sp. HY1]
MRPNQNKRMRGRNTSNRKGPNPLSRTYESNGPDVKIRGTAHHIGEKYLQLARDAQSSGDPVTAESFLQHAEHYFRLIAAAQAAQQVANGYQRQPGEPEVEEFDEDEDFSGGMDRFASPIERVAPAQPTYPQPVSNQNQPTYPEREQRGSYGNGERQGYERQERGPRQDRNFQDRGYQDRNFQDRSPDRSGQDAPQERNYRDRSQERNFDRPERPVSDRPARENEPRNGRGGRGRDYRSDNGSRENSSRDNSARDNGPRDNGARDNGARDNGSRDNGVRYERGEPRGPVEDIDGNKGLPAFITSPVRLQPESHLSGIGGQPVTAEILERSEAETEATGFHLRPRRRRRSKAELGEGPAEITSARDPVGD